MDGFILTLTPNPALDLSGLVDRVVPDEKSYVYDQMKTPGGNAINVSRILHRLNVPTLASGFLGGSVGDEIQALLDREKVAHHFIPIRGSSRICVTVSDRHSHRQTRLNFPGPRLLPREKEALRNWVRRKKGLGALILGGSFPQGFGVTDARKILHEAHARGIPTIVDCPGPLMRDLIIARPILIKPNLTEFQELVGKKVHRLAAVLREARPLLKRVRYVCVSSVEGGTLLLSERGAYFGRIPRVAVRSTVGAGDSMVALMGREIFKGESRPPEILRWGMAGAAATLSHPGITLGTRREIQELFKKTKVQEI